MGTSAKVLSSSELQRVLAFVSQGRSPSRNTVIILLSFRAGLRACEIAGLTWPMVADANGRMSDKLCISGKIAKNGRQRIVPMHPDLKRALSVLHKAEDRPTTGPVVRSQRKEHFTARGIVNWFAAIYAEMGLEGCSSHSGRRTFITQSARLIAKAGGSLRDVQELAGHSALTTTERYIEGDRDAQRKLVNLLT